MQDKLLVEAIGKRITAFSKLGLRDGVTVIGQGFGRDKRARSATTDKKGNQDNQNRCR
ncbi:MAG: hypothetical protein KAI38_09740 [Candidatus Latescibacteria bacterium]|nr:hypothetical protein [Candidatus Latescibacterota bacterium]